MLSEQQIQWVVFQYIYDGCSSDNLPQTYQYNDEALNDINKAILEYLRHESRAVPSINLMSAVKGTKDLDERLKLIFSSKLFSPTLILIYFARRFELEPFTKALNHGGDAFEMLDGTSAAKILVEKKDELIKSVQQSANSHADSSLLAVIDEMHRVVTQHLKQSFTSAARAANLTPEELLFFGLFFIQTNDTTHITHPEVKKYFAGLKQAPLVEKYTAILDYLPRYVKPDTEIILDKTIVNDKTIPQTMTLLSHAVSGLFLCEGGDTRYWNEQQAIVVRQLIKRSRENLHVVNRRNNMGLSPLEIAIHGNNLQVITDLVKASFLSKSQKAAASPNKAFKSSDLIDAINKNQIRLTEELLLTALKKNIDLRKDKTAAKLLDNTLASCSLNMLVVLISHGFMTNDDQQADKTNDDESLPILAYWLLNINVNLTDLLAGLRLLIAAGAPYRDSRVIDVVLSHEIHRKEVTEFFAGLVEPLSPEEVSHVSLLLAPFYKLLLAGDDENAAVAVPIFVQVLNFVNEYGYSPLHLAAQNNLLLFFRAWHSLTPDMELNYADNRKVPSPLSLAIDYGNASMMEELAALGAIPFDETGAVDLIRAIHSENLWVFDNAWQAFSDNSLSDAEKHALISSALQSVSTSNLNSLVRGIVSEKLSAGLMVEEFATVSEQDSEPFISPYFKNISDCSKSEKNNLLAIALHGYYGLTLADAQRFINAGADIDHLVSGSSQCLLVKILDPLAIIAPEVRIGAVKFLLDEGVLEKKNTRKIRKELISFAVQLSEYPGYEITSLLLNKKLPMAEGRVDMQPLHVVNSAKVAALLIERGANKEKPGKYGRTPLLTQIARFNLGVVEVLLENGAKTEVKSTLGETATTIALKNQFIEILDALIRYKVSFFNSRATLYQAAKTSWYMQSACLSSFTSYWLALNENDPFISGIINRNFQVVKDAIDEHKERLNQRDSSGNNAIFYCFSKTDELTHLGVSANSFFPNDAFDFEACFTETRDLFELLVENGAEIENITPRGDNVLHCAAKLPNFEMMMYLIRKYPHLNAKKNNDGKTPLDLLNNSYALLFYRAMEPELSVEDSTMIQDALSFNFFYQKYVKTKDLFERIENRGKNKKCSPQTNIKNEKPKGKGRRNKNNFSPERDTDDVDGALGLRERQSEEPTSQQKKQRKLQEEIKQIAKAEQMRLKAKNDEKAKTKIIPKSIISGSENQTKKIANSSNNHSSRSPAASSSQVVLNLRAASSSQFAVSSRAASSSQAASSSTLYSSSPEDDYLWTLDPASASTSSSVDDSLSPSFSSTDESVDEALSCSSSDTEFSARTTASQFSFFTLENPMEYFKRKSQVKYAQQSAASAGGNAHGAKTWSSFFYFELANFVDFALANVIEDSSFESQDPWPPAKKISL